MARENLWNTRISWWWWWRSQHMDSYPRCVGRSFTSPQRTNINGMEDCNWRRPSKVVGSYMNWQISRRSIECREVWPTRTQIERLLDDDGFLKFWGSRSSIRLACEKELKRMVSSEEVSMSKRCFLSWFVQVAYSCTSKKPWVDFRYQMFACLWLKQDFIVSFESRRSHWQWKNVWNTWCQHGPVRTGRWIGGPWLSRCRCAPTKHWQCFSWRGRWGRVPLEEDDVVGTPFLGPNPMTEIELRFEDLFLLEVRHILTEPLQQVLGSTIDAYKWALVKRLDEVFRFRLLKRHFQFQLWISHDSTWQRVSYSSTIEEELNRFQERTRLSRYCLRLTLNPDITPQIVDDHRSQDMRRMSQKGTWLRFPDFHGRMQSMLHDLKMKISRSEMWELHATLITGSLGFRVGKIRDSGPLRRSSSITKKFQMEFRV